MSADCVSLKPRRKAHAYHALSIAERKLVEHFNQILPEPLPRSATTELNRYQSRQAAAGCSSRRT